MTKKKTHIQSRWRLASDVEPEDRSLVLIRLNDRYNIAEYRKLSACFIAKTGEIYSRSHKGLEWGDLMIRGGQYSNNTEESAPDPSSGLHMV